MINAREVRKNADEKYRIKKQRAREEVREWMEEKDLERMIIHASEEALYEVSINAQSCPDNEVLNEILTEAGFSHYRPFGGSILKISWDEPEEIE